MRSRRSSSWRAMSRPAAGATPSRVERVAGDILRAEPFLLASGVRERRPAVSPACSSRTDRRAPRAASRRRTNSGSLKVSAFRPFGVVGRERQVNQLFGLRTGSGLRISASTSENAATHAPRASDSDDTAAPVTTAFFRSMRTPRRTSRISESSQGSSLTSRLCSRSRSGLPNRRAASPGGGLGVMPAAVSSRMRSSTWNWSSSSSSDSTRPDRNTLARP